MKHLYYCRHAQSQYGSENRWAGTSDTPLSALGKTQAEQAGVRAESMKIDLMISSPQIRALDTAKTIASHIGYPEDAIEINPLIVERNFGELEGTAWDPEFNVDSIATVEHADSVIARARKFYDYLQTLDAENILVVGHGTFGRAFRHVIHPEIPFNNTGRFENAVIVELL